MNVDTRQRLILWLALLLFLVPPANAEKQTAHEQPGLPGAKPKMYRSADGKLYVPGLLPVKLSFSAGGDREDAPAPAWTFNKEGKQLLSAGGQSGGPVEIYVDLTPPRSGMLLSRGPLHKRAGQTYYGKGVVLTVSPGDALSGVQATYLSVNGAPFVLLKGDFETFAPNRENIVRVLSIDNVGNIEPVRSRSFYHDTAPPASTHRVTGVTFPGPVLAPGCTITLEASDSAAGVKGIYYRLDNGPEKQYRKPLRINGLTQGKHSLAWYAVDKVDNREAPHRFDFDHDNRPPVVSLAVEGPSHLLEGTLFVSGSTRLKVGAADSLAGVAAIHYRIDSGQDVLYEIPFLLPRQGGRHKVRVTAADNVANHSEPLSRHFYLDLTPPESEFKIGGFYTNFKEEFIIRKEVALHLSSVDLEAGVRTIQYRVNEGPTLDYTGPITLDKDGRYHVAYWADDRVGNVEKANLIKLRVDNSTALAGYRKPPARYPKQWYLHPDGRLMGSTGLPFFLYIGLTGKDGETVGDPILLDLGKYSQGGEGPVTFPKGGVNYLEIFTGLPGKRGGETFPVLIDALPPQTAISFSGAALCTQKNTRCFGPGLEIRFNGADVNKGIVSGFKETRVSVDNSGFFSYTEPLRIFSRQKTFTVEYFSLDNVGNAEKPRRIRFTVDTTPPVTNRSVGGVKSGNTLSGRSVITLTPTDNHSGVKTLYYAFDGGKQRIYRGPLTGRLLTALPEGEHTLRYFAKDRVGNREDPRQMVFLLDNHGPVVRLTVTGQQHTIGKILYLSAGSRIRFSAADPRSEVKNIRYRIDSGAPEVYRTPLTAPSVSRRCTVGYSAEDNAGNTTPWQYRAVVADNTAPHTQLTFNGPVFNDRFRFYAGPQTGMVLSARDTGAGVREILCSVDNGPFKNITAPFNIRGGGKHRVRFRAVDNVGNAENVTAKDIYIDNTPPKLTVFYNMRSFRTTVSNTPVYPSNLTVSFIASDSDTEVDKILYRIDGGREHLYRNPLSRFPGGRDITLTIYAYDRLGNRAQREVTFRVEKGEE